MSLSFIQTVFVHNLSKQWEAEDESGERDMTLQSSSSMTTVLFVVSQKGARIVVFTDGLWLAIDIIVHCH